MVYLGQNLLKVPVSEPLIAAKYYGVNRYAELSLSKERNKKIGKTK